MSNLKQEAICLGLACAFIHNNCYSQTSAERPFAGEQQVTSKLFNIDELSINYHFSSELPEGQYVLAEWSRMSDWKGGNEMTSVIDLAKRYYNQVADSFRESTTSKRLDVHVPIEGEPVTVNITEHPSTSHVVLLKANVQAPLKTGMDTLRVLKTYREVMTKGLPRLVQVQYTFLLKDIDNINQLNEYKSAITDVERQFDEVVAKFKRRWRSDDKWTHNLTTNYLPYNPDPTKKLTVTRKMIETEQGRYYKAWEADMALGATLFRNAPCAAIDMGVSYKWPAKLSAYNYIRFSVNTFHNFIWNSPTSADDFPLAFANLEFGAIRSAQRRHIPMYQAAIGVGYAYNGPDQPGASYKIHDPTLPTHLLKTYLSFKLSKAVTLTMDSYVGYATGMSAYIRVF